MVATSCWPSSTENRSVMGDRATSSPASKPSACSVKGMGVLTSSTSTPMDGSASKRSASGRMDSRISSTPSESASSRARPSLTVMAV